jgi:anthraniloyl-CoA monooxygenase
MRIACLGGGPGGLYFAISMKLRNPDSDVTVFERNKPNDTFGWGVVLSDQTLGNLRDNDAESAEMIKDHFAYWDDLAVVYRGVREESTGHGFCGIGRMRLLLILQERAKNLGVILEFDTDVKSVDDLKADYDVVVASDGLNSKTRQRYENVFEPIIDNRACKFVWLGTHQKFDDAFTFIFEQTDKGWLWAHAYQFDDNTATFIVETDEKTWEKYGFGEMDQQESIAVCQDVFKNHLGGHALMTNAKHIRGSAWINFPRVLCKKWHHDNIVLMGDAAATAHFSIGSGTKLALESAISLAEFLHTEDSLPAAFAKYETERRTQVLRIQSAALNSLEWFENIHRYLDYDPVQFNYSQLTRSQRISHENLRLRDAKWLESAERWFQGNDEPLRTPMFAPFALRDLQLDNRMVLAPISQYKATGGLISDWHTIHYGERSKGGAGLLVTEALAVSETGRATLGDAGLYDDAQIAGWKAVVGFTKAEGSTKICAQLGHAGPRSSSKVPWDGENQALTDGWTALAASELQWGRLSTKVIPMSDTDMQDVIAEFASAAKRAEQAGFDMIEIHAAAGGLLASFLSPVTNLRTDSFGGDWQGRLRFPLAVVKAVRADWPDHKPLSVRLCAHDWLDNGLTEADAIEYVRAFSSAGVDIHVVTTGETLETSKPRYGRMYQTPFSDTLRNELKVATMTVGNITEADHANSILLAGRADLVAIGRPHLADPYWVNRQAALLGDGFQKWPAPYVYGANQLKTLEAKNLKGAS